jgi:hypothetical protein
MNTLSLLTVAQPSILIPSTTVLPAPITLPAPLSYEFQVVEFVTDNKITKVELQMKVNQHNQHGDISLHGTWNPVPRVQITV